MKDEEEDVTINEYRKNKEKAMSFLNKLKDKGSGVKITKHSESGVTTFVGIIREISVSDPTYLFLDSLGKKSRIVFRHYRDDIEEL